MAELCTTKSFTLEGFQLAEDIGTGAVWSSAFQLGVVYNSKRRGTGDGILFNNEIDHAGGREPSKVHRLLSSKSTGKKTTRGSLQRLGICHHPYNSTFGGRTD